MHEFILKVNRKRFRFHFYKFVPAANFVKIYFSQPLSGAGTFQNKLPPIENNGFTNYNITACISIYYNRLLLRSINCFTITAR